MSMLLMVQALKAKVGNPLRKLVLVKLADQANDDGECWPSYQSIADACEMGRSTVKAHIAWLEEHGFLRVEYRHYGSGGKSKSNIYHLTIGKGSESVKSRPGQILTGSDADLPRSDADPFNGSNPDPEPVNKPIKESFPPSEGEARAPEPPPPKPAKAKTPRQEEPTRIPEDFAPSESSCAWFASKGYAFDRDEETEKFCDYWRESKRDNAWKMDWQAAWKNWMRRTHEGFATMPARRQPPQPFAGQGCTFDQTGREVSPAGVPGMPVAGFGGQPQRTSKMAQGISLLEELKDEIRRGEV